MNYTPPLGNAVDFTSYLTTGYTAPIGNAVDVWTEASLFSAGGYTALVYGPGDIAQAHTADEFVTLAQLQRYAGSVDTIINGGR